MESSNQEDSEGKEEFQKMQKLERFFNQKEETRIKTPHS